MADREARAHVLYQPLSALRITDPIINSLEMIMTTNDTNFQIGSKMYQSVNASSNGWRIEDHVANILLIEDNLATVRLVEKVLAPYKHVIHHYELGMDGLFHAPHLKLDLALIDLGLPDISGKLIGFELKQVLRADVPVIAFTAESGARAERLALSYGFDGFMSKPIDTHLFPRQIAALLKEPPPVGIPRKNT